jgi:hypothetical protein
MSLVLLVEVFITCHYTNVTYEVKMIHQFAPNQNISRVYTVTAQFAKTCVIQ